MRKILLITAVLLDAAMLSGQYRMTLDTVMLADVMVSGTIPVDNSQIAQFYRTNYFSTIDNLTGHLEGVSLIKRGAYAMEPQLNGFSGGQLNVTIDGMRMFGACTDKMDPVTSYLEPVNLGSISIQHGTAGALFGNNVGGSMDLSLSEPEKFGTRPLGGSLSAGYESISHSRNLLLSLSYIKDKWELGLNGVYRRNDSYRDGRNNLVPYSRFEKYNFHTVLKFLPDSVSSVRADILWDLALDVGYPALPMDVSRARAALAGLEYKKTAHRYDLRAKIYYNSVFHLMDDSGRDSLFFLDDPVNGGTDSVYMRMDMPGWSNTLGSYIQSDFRISRKNKLTVKADTYFNSVLAEMTMHMHFAGAPAEPPMYLQTWPDMMRSVSGLYLSNTTRFNNKFLMSVNGRIDYNTDRFKSPVMQEQFTVFNFKLPDYSGNITKGLNLSVEYKVLPAIKISLLSGYSERIPTISERYGFYLYNAYDGYDYIGNPLLRNEKSVSARFNITYFDHTLKVNLSQSANFLFDYILGVTDTLIPPMNFYTNGLREYKNVEGVKIYNTDLQVLYRPTANLSFFLLTKFTLGQMDSKQPLPLIPPFRSTLSVSYETKKWMLQVDNETALRQNRINEDYGETRSPSFTIFNFKAGYQFKLKGSQLDASSGITNIFNSYYYEHLDWGHIPRPGRSFNILLRYRF